MQFRVPEEAVWSEMLFSQLTTGWYDWAVAHRLRTQNTHCWSITAAYYAQYMLLGSLLLSYRNGSIHREQRKNQLIEGLTQSHQALIRFYQSRELTLNLKRDSKIETHEVDSFRREFLNHFSEVVGISQEAADRILRTYGEILQVGKFTRESHTYHVLVVSHQMIPSVNVMNKTFYPRETVQKLGESLLETLPSINRMVMKVVSEVISSLEPEARALHFRHLSEEIEDFYKLADHEHLVPLPDVLEVCLSKLQERCALESKELDPEVYEQFQHHFAKFDLKKRDYSYVTKNKENMLQVLNSLKACEICFCQA